ncbi:hypothetical protein PL373_18965 [Tenacibaculum maritimum]|nr:hypothetical protein [Tenacibaculum maritimum]MDB0603170.1 hypothetical protein [Tenacibaculum maritimum]MDB0610433.1 hypothetical protein [Tenacibaculum maritimum]
MTNHYNIEVLETSTHFKATYRDNKFRKLEHLRGKITIPMLKAVGRIIPLVEDSFAAYTIEFKDKVTYTSLSENKVATIFSQFNTAWFRFFRTENNGLEPKFTGADGKALKQIINYLKGINNGNETAALANWDLLLNNWSSLSDFNQGQTDLKYINSRLNVIIREIIRNNGGNVTGTNGSVSI